MFALTAAAHGGTNPTTILFLIAAVVAVIFWRSLVKVGLALLVIGFLILLFEGGSAILHGL